jgi:hypothetical protein
MTSDDRALETAAAEKKAYNERDCEETRDDSVPAPARTLTRISALSHTEAKEIENQLKRD